jgi:hypothetical protein
MTIRVTLGLAVIAIGFGLAALAGIPALIENRSVGDVVVAVGFAVALGGIVVGVTGIPAEIRAWRRHKADGAATVANLKVKRRRIQHTKVDALVRLTEARQAVEGSRALGDMGPMREHLKTVRGLELENVIVEAELDFNANEFRRHGVDVDAFDNVPNP